MPNSLKSKIKHLCHNGTITERDRDRILKALEQKSCEDCISRQAILDELERCHITSGVKNQGTWNECVDSIMRTIGSMPSVQSQKVSSWIPVSERLPNFNDIVLASADTDYEELRVILTVYSAEEFWFNGKIKAWMPLPEPYKERRESNGY